jgi:hypothetical protein
MKQAPSATEATATPMPGVWSESPTGTSNAPASTGNRRRLLSAGGAG